MLNPTLIHKLLDKIEHSSLSKVMSGWEQCLIELPSNYEKSWKIT